MEAWFPVFSFWMMIFISITKLALYVVMVALVLVIIDKLRRYK